MKADAWWRCGGWAPCCVDPNCKLACTYRRCKRTARYHGRHQGHHWAAARSLPAPQAWLPAAYGLRGPSGLRLGCVARLWLQGAHLDRKLEAHAADWQEGKDLKAGQAHHGRRSIRAEGPVRSRGTRESRTAHRARGTPCLPRLVGLRHPGTLTATVADGPAYV